MAGLRLTPRAWMAIGVGAGAAAIVGVALFTIGPLAPDDAATPTPRASAIPSAEPTASPSVTASADVVFTFARDAGIDDATALARMANPRTGETWHAPVERPDYAAAFALYSEFFPPQTYFSIGERDGYDIVVAAYYEEPVAYYDSPAELGWLSLWGGFFEMRDGVPVLIAHPWEAPGSCSDYYSWWIDYYDALVVDPVVFYDSLSYPTTLTIDSQTTVTLHEWDDWTDGCQFAFPGVPLPWEREFGNSGAADLVDQGLSALSGVGPVDVVRLEWPSQVTGLINGQYYVRTPYDTLLTTYLTHPPGDDFGDIVWIDGHAPTNPGGDEWLSLGPAASDTCWDPTQFTREINHVDGDWVVAGTSPDGVDLYVPIDGGNPVALRVFTRMSDMSSMDGRRIGPWSNFRPWMSGQSVHAEQAPPYPYATYEDFLADNALLAFQAPDGSWRLVVRGSAFYTVYECS